MTATVFNWPVRIYWEDTDAGGIVFYANYLKFFERARTEWLRNLGLEQQALHTEAGGMFVVSDVQLRYLQPARLDDTLRVTAALTGTGRASLQLHQQAWRSSARGEPETLLCEGHIRIGWVDAHSHRPQRMPAQVLAVLHPAGH